MSGEPSGEAVPEQDARVTASEYTFEAEGLTPGKNTIVFENAGDEPHHLVAVPIAAGKTFADVKEFFRDREGAKGPPPIEEEAVDTSVLEGGASQVVDLDLKAGDYAFVCYVGDREGGPQHVDKGMVTGVTVE